MPTLLDKTGLRAFSTKTSNAAKNTILDCALSLSLVVSIDFVNMYFIEFLTASPLTYFPSVVSHFQNTLFQVCH